MARGGVGDNLTLFEDWVRSQVAHLYSDLERQAERITMLENRLANAERELTALRISVRGLPVDDGG